jgi:hypothetical protein
MKEDRRHRRKDLPAVEFDDGHKEWCIDGMLHRDGDFPAVTSNGAMKWYKFGKCHRENDLPAHIISDGTQFWYKNGIEYTFSKYENGTKEWRDNYGILHNYHGPAIIYSNGDVEYWVRGKRHRINGPAVIIGKKQYFFEFGEFKKCIFCI